MTTSSSSSSSTAAAAAVTTTTTVAATTGAGWRTFRLFDSDASRCALSLLCDDAVVTCGCAVDAQHLVVCDSAGYVHVVPRHRTCSDDNDNDENKDGDGNNNNNTTAAATPQRGSRAHNNSSSNNDADGSDAATSSTMRVLRFAAYDGGPVTHVAYAHARRVLVTVGCDAVVRDGRARNNTSNAASATRTHDGTVDAAHVLAASNATTASTTPTAAATTTTTTLTAPLVRVWDMRDGTTSHNNNNAASALAMTAAAARHVASASSPPPLCCEVRLFTDGHPPPHETAPLTQSLLQQHAMTSATTPATAASPSSSPRQAAVAHDDDGDSDDTRDAAATWWRSVVVGVDVTADATLAVVGLSSGECVLLCGALTRGVRHICLRRLRSNSNDNDNVSSTRDATHATASSARGRLTFVALPPRGRVHIGHRRATTTATAHVHTAAHAATTRHGDAHGHTTTTTAEAQVLYTVYERGVYAWSLPAAYYSSNSNNSNSNTTMVADAAAAARTPPSSQQPREYTCALRTGAAYGHACLRHDGALVLVSTAADRVAMLCATPPPPQQQQQQQQQQQPSPPTTTHTTTATCACYDPTSTTAVYSADLTCFARKDEHNSSNNSSIVAALTTHRDYVVLLTHDTPLRTRATPPLPSSSSPPQQQQRTSSTRTAATTAVVPRYRLQCYEVVHRLRGVDRAHEAGHTQCALLLADAHDVMLLSHEQQQQQQHVSSVAVAPAQATHATAAASSSPHTRAAWQLLRLREVDLRRKLDALCAAEYDAVAYAIVAEARARACRANDNTDDNDGGSGSDVRQQQHDHDDETSSDSRRRRVALLTTLQQSVLKRYADALYRRGQYDDAMTRYVDTIGHLAPSYVVQRYTAAQHTHLLIRYLEALHSNNNNNNKSTARATDARTRAAQVAYTTLLLHCYLRIDDAAALRAFVQRDDVRLDAAHAIALCRRARCVDAALCIAERYARARDVVRLLLYDATPPRTRDALAALRRCSVDVAEALLRRCGAVGSDLLHRQPRRTTELLIELCVHWPGPARRLPRDTRDDGVVARAASAAAADGDATSSAAAFADDDDDDDDHDDDDVTRMRGHPHRAHAASFLHVFVDMPVCLLYFLRAVVASGVLDDDDDNNNNNNNNDSNNNNDEGSRAAEAERQRAIYHTLFELYVTRDLLQRLVVGDADAARPSHDDACARATATTTTTTQSQDARDDAPRAAAASATSPHTTTADAVRDVSCDDGDDDDDDAERWLPVESLASRRAQAMLLLQAYAGRYDVYTMLSLAHAHDYADGVVWLLWRMRRYAELQQWYMSNVEQAAATATATATGSAAGSAAGQDDKDNNDDGDGGGDDSLREAIAQLLRVCHELEDAYAATPHHDDMSDHDDDDDDKHADDDDADDAADAVAAMWLRVLALLVRCVPDDGEDNNNDSSRHVDIVVEAVAYTLAHIDAHGLLTPAVVLDVLSRAHARVPLRAVRAYYTSVLQRERQLACRARALCARSAQQLRALDADVTALHTTPLALRSTHCAHCGGALTLPAVHFYCRHSYHQRCVGDALVCALCAPQHCRELEHVDAEEAADDDDSDDKALLQQLLRCDADTTTTNAAAAARDDDAVSSVTAIHSNNNDNSNKSSRSDAPQQQQATTTLPYHSARALGDFLRCVRHDLLTPSSLSSSRQQQRRQHTSPHGSAVAHVEHNNDNNDSAATATRYDVLVSHSVDSTKERVRALCLPLLHATAYKAMCAGSSSGDGDNKKRTRGCGDALLLLGDDDSDFDSDSDSDSDDDSDDDDDDEDDEQVDVW